MLMMLMIMMMMMMMMMMVMVMLIIARDDDNDGNNNDLFFYLCCGGGTELGLARPAATLNINVGPPCPSGALSTKRLAEQERAFLVPCWRLLADGAAVSRSGCSGCTPPHRQRNRPATVRVGPRTPWPLPGSGAWGVRGHPMRDPVPWGGVDNTFVQAKLHGFFHNFVRRLRRARAACPSACIAECCAVKASQRDGTCC